MRTGTQARVAQWQSRGLISPWSGVQLSPLAPDHALLAAACPATRKSGQSCGRSVCKTAARPERRVFAGMGLRTPSGPCAGYPALAGFFGCSSRCRESAGSSRWARGIRVMHFRHGGTCNARLSHAALQPAWACRWGRYLPLPILGQCCRNLRQPGATVHVVPSASGT